MATMNVTPARVEDAIRETDWVAVDALTDAEIAARVGNDPDAAPILSTGETASALARTARAWLGISQTVFAGDREGT